MSEFAHDSRAGRPSLSGGIERVYDELASTLERAAYLYGNAAFFDLERARQIRRAFDVAVAKSEGFLRNNNEEGSSVASASGGTNRAQRIENEILGFIQDMQKPVTIDEVFDHLNSVSLGEPRASLITRMSRMVAADKLTRSGRGYYEIME